MDKISKKVMDRIKDEKLIPESKLFSNIKKYSLWIPAILALLFGSFASSLIFYFVYNSELDLICATGGKFILRAMPYFWIVSLLLFLLVTNYYYRKTALGHRRRISLIIGIYLLITITLGFAFSAIGIPTYFQKNMNGKGFMNSIMFNQTSAWSHPEDGLLSGRILEISNERINIIDFNDKTWVIDISNTLVKKHAIIEVGQQIKIIGNVSDKIFVASEIRPWISGMRQGKHLKMR